MFHIQPGRKQLINPALNGLITGLETSRINPVEKFAS